MKTYTHPISGVRIEGIRLGPWVELQRDDFYDSTSGVWASCPCPRTRTEPGCDAIWIRKVDLSPEAAMLLVHIADHRAPEPERPHAALQELHSLGLVAKAVDEGIYELTDAGRDYAKFLAG